MMIQNKIKQEQIYTAILWGLVIILTLVPFFRVGFTTGDDLEYYLTRVSLSAETPVFQPEGFSISNMIKETY